MTDDAEIRWQHEKEDLEAALKEAQEKADKLAEILEAERRNGDALSDLHAKIEVALERGCYLVKLMHENDPTEPVADNGATVWDAELVDWAHWADQAMALRGTL